MSDDCTTNPCQLCRKRENGDPCSPGCPGWAVFNEGTEREGIERCDACDIFESDDAAREHVKGVLGAALAKNGGWSVDVWNALYEQERAHVLLMQAVDLLGHARTQITDCAAAALTPEQLVDAIDALVDAL